MPSTTVSDADWTVLAPEVCVRLLGDPSSRSSREWRWGRRGSFRLNLQTGTWNDFEAGDGGGVIALVMREERCDRTAAAEWLRQQGFLPERDRPQRSVGAIPRLNAKSATPRGTRPAAKKNAADSQRRQHVNDVIRQAREIPMDPEHPVRLWAAQRNLWRADVPFPRRMTRGAFATRCCGYRRRRHSSKGNTWVPGRPWRQLHQSLIGNVRTLTIQRRKGYSSSR